MDIITYFSEPIEKRKEIVQNASRTTSPFWLCQLHLAFENHSPIGLNFLDKRLGSEYWVLITKN